MTKLFIIRNQHGQYLSKQQEWLDGSDRNLLYRTVHRDEAINTVFEVSSRDIYLRAETLVCDADARGNPQLGEGAVAARDLQPPHDDSEQPVAAENGTVEAVEPDDDSDAIVTVDTDHDEATV